LSERLLSKAEVWQDASGKCAIEISFRSKEELERLVMTLD
jgi:hypothetical protein